MKVAITEKILPNYKGELWYCNTFYKVFKKQMTKLFIVHKQVEVNGKPVFDWDDINEKAKEYGFEIILLHDIKEVKEYTKYPYKEIVDYFGTDYFCSSLDYMIAYAIYTGYDEIDILTIFLLEDVDYTDSLWEKCGVEHWLGRAQAMGVKVNNLPLSNVFAMRYGRPYAING